MNVEDAVTQAMAANSNQRLPPKPTTASTVKETLTWFSQLFPASDQMRRVLDYALSIPYSVEAGFSVSVESLHNMPDIGPGAGDDGKTGGLFNRRGVRISDATYIYKVIVSTYPPGLFYKEPPLLDSVFYSKIVDFDSVSNPFSFCIVCS